MVVVVMTVVEENAGDCGYSDARSNYGDAAVDLLVWIGALQSRLSTGPTGVMGRMGLGGDGVGVGGLHPFSAGPWLRITDAWPETNRMTHR